jgi:hypothetical protein
MKKEDISLCQHCWSMTHTLKNNKCGKCKKNKKLSEKETKNLEIRAKKALEEYNKHPFDPERDCDARSKADYFSVGGSDF